MEDHLGKVCLLNNKEMAQWSVLRLRRNESTVKHVRFSIQSYMFTALLTNV